MAWLCICECVQHFSVYRHNEFNLVLMMKTRDGETKNNKINNAFRRRAQ